MSGGLAFFPKLNGPFALDTAKLSKPEADELESLVDAARFFERDETIAATNPAGADSRSFSITIESEHTTHTVNVSEPVADTKLGELIQRIRALAASQST